ncbi:MAG: hypothetical protein FD146_2428 [Anaerolineaceae bacterium]|nr:MAG: hypothetical protein FD146_2428 [Anaerolineaceae bacterium]
MKKAAPVLRTVILLAALLAACAPGASRAGEARQALVAFFDHLNCGEYAEADALYGGDYEALVSFNPALDPADHAALWQNGCRMNGLQCLTVRSATLKDHHSDTYVFFVEFNDPNGSLFVRGPCCGATETEMPSESHFEYRVAETADGQFKVLDLPVYVP